MRLQIIGIADRGIPNRERLHLRVLAEVNLSFYAIFNTVYINSGAVSNDPKNVYWFPATLVKPGDQIILFSGYGVNRIEPAVNGGTNHIFYWGQSNTLWSQYGNCAVVLEVSTWQTSPLE